MPMSPRLLRPRVGGAFTPRSLSGLAAWFDADDASTITLNGSTVSEWRDKSGNNRHATQGTSGRQPTYTTNSLNGKPALTALGEGIANKGMTVAAFPFSNAHTAIFVFRASAANQTIFLRGANLNDQPRATVSGSPLTFGGFKGGTSQAQVFSTITYPAAQWSIAGFINNVSLLRGYLNGVYGTDATSNTESWSGNSALRLFSLSDTLHTLNGGIAEFIYYDRQLTASEVARVALYLSRKWNISLAPQVSNADAQSWIDRVYSNGGTVSTSTAAAVNTFCNDIDAAGIRDRFYRLNLFAGTSLNAALVPLYRGPSLGGTQFGGTTDTNNNFVSGDYVETGSTGGLKGNGSTKFLATGLPMTFLGTNQLHLYASMVPDASGLAQQVLAARANLTGSVALEHVFNGTTLNRHRIALFSTGGQPASNASPITGRTQLLSQIPTGTTVKNYARNVDIGDTGGGAYSATNTTQFYVFAGEQTGTGMAGHAFVRMDAYSVGATFTSDAQRNAFHNAMSDFRTALSRT